MTLTAITAEPGGDEAVRQRLADRGVADLKFEVKSDPDHSFLVKDAGDIYTLKAHEWEVSGNYEMVQPAIVVLDANGATVKECTWSWKTMGYSNGQAMDMVPFEGEQFPLVTFRPVISDLVPSVKERRPIKLAPIKKF
ncbi:hypothetical protein CTAYLR_005146 [Chrysophaeum taylorii]|uniref:Uncharacterized protein n=1 Tax=Chrysophaeum taylorii TaxID=2483200 RepID=A0AAD7UFN3_9STRA|nr:hypothetical protein CTAYLR_005146 [Chrysophaeum taylorii]